MPNRAVPRPVQPGLPVPCTMPGYDLHPIHCRPVQYTVRMTRILVHSVLGELYIGHLEAAVPDAATIANPNQLPRVLQDRLQLGP